MATRVLRATDLTVEGNFIVTGTSTTVNSTNATLKDNVITLNEGEPGAGVTLGTAGIEVDRGTEDNAQLIWDEVTDTWQMKLGSTVVGTVSSGLPSARSAIIYAIIFGG